MTLLLALTASVLALHCGEDEGARNVSVSDDAGVDAARDRDAADTSSNDEPDAGTNADASDASDDAAFEDGNDADPSTESGSDAEDGSTPPLCRAPEPKPPGPGSCGDGFRDQSSEECDDGNASGGDLCGSDCRITDRLVAPPPAPPSSSLPPHRLGFGRHVVSSGCEGFGVVYVDGSGPPSVSLATFDARGTPAEVVTEVSTGTTLPSAPEPVIAGLPNHRFAVAWNDLGGDGDRLGVAMRLVDPSSTLSASPSYANVSRAFSQYDPDIVGTESELIVAWVDDSALDTGPDIRFRRFDHQLIALSQSDETLAETGSPESSVALAAFGSGWVAAWRTAAAAGERIDVKSGSTEWHVEGHAPGPASDKPSIAMLDASHLLVVFTNGVPANSTFRLQGAVLDTAHPGAATGFAIDPLVSVGTGVSHTRPALVRTAERVYLAWQSMASSSDPNAEEVWLKEISWTEAAGAITLDLSRVEIALPRSAAHQTGDQRIPALSAVSLWPNGAVAAVWEDYGQVFGAGAGKPDIAVQFIPLPALRAAPGATREGRVLTR